MEPFAWNTFDRPKDKLAPYTRISSKKEKKYNAKAFSMFFQISNILKIYLRKTICLYQKLSVVISLFANFVKMPKNTKFKISFINSVQSYTALVKTSVIKPEKLNYSHIII